MVRTLIRAQQVGGNDAVNRLFISYGNAMHGRSDDMNELDVQQRCLADAGLPTELFDQAQADPETENHMVAITRQAIDKYQLFGVPTLVLKAQCCRVRTRHSPGAHWRRGARIVGLHALLAQAAISV